MFFLCALVDAGRAFVFVRVATSKFDEFAGSVFYVVTPSRMKRVKIAAVKLDNLPTSTLENFDSFVYVHVICLLKVLPPLPTATVGEEDFVSSYRKVNWRCLEHQDKDHFSRLLDARLLLLRR